MTYLCCASAAVLAGAAAPAASAQNAALLGAAAAALAPGGTLLSAVLLAAGAADWLPGAVLLAVSVGAGVGSRLDQRPSCLGPHRLAPPNATVSAQVPLAMLAARAAGHSRPSSSSTSPLPAALGPIAAYCGLAAATLAALPSLAQLLPPGATAWAGCLLGSAGGLALWPAAQQALAGDPLAWVGGRASQQDAFQLGGAPPLLPAASLQPGLGLHWYLMAQAFPRFRCAPLVFLSRSTALLCRCYAAAWPDACLCILQPSAGLSFCLCSRACLPPPWSRWRCASHASQSCFCLRAHCCAACCTRGRSPPWRRSGWCVRGGLEAW